MTLAATVLAGSALAATASAAPESASEPVTLTGRVLNAATGAPIVSALVQVEGPRYAALTDRAGGYTLRVPRTDLPAPKMRIAVAGMGFGSETVEVDLPPESVSTLEVDIRLHARELVLSDVTVSTICRIDTSGTRPDSGFVSLSQHGESSISTTWGNGSEATRQIRSRSPDTSR